MVIRLITIRELQILNKKKTKRKRAENVQESDSKQKFLSGIFKNNGIKNSLNTSANDLIHLVLLGSASLYMWSAHSIVSPFIRSSTSSLKASTTSRIAVEAGESAYSTKKHSPLSQDLPMRGSSGTDPKNLIFNS